MIVYFVVYYWRRVFFCRVSSSFIIFIRIWIIYWSRYVRSWFNLIFIFLLLLLLEFIFDFFFRILILVLFMVVVISKIIFRELYFVFLGLLGLGGGRVRVFWSLRCVGIWCWEVSSCDLRWVMCLLCWKGAFDFFVLCCGLGCMAL